MSQAICPMVSLRLHGNEFSLISDALSFASNQISDSGYKPEHVEAFIIRLNAAFTLAEKRANIDERTLVEYSKPEAVPIVYTIRLHGSDIWLILDALGFASRQLCNADYQAEHVEGFVTRLNAAFTRAHYQAHSPNAQ